MSNTLACRVLYLFLSITLFLCSCENKDQVIYKGDARSSIKLQNILSLYKIPFNTNQSGSETQVSVTPFYKKKATDIFFSVKDYIGNSNFDFKNVFIPKTNQEDELFKSQIEDFKYVLEVKKLENNNQYLVVLPDNLEAKNYLKSELEKYLPEETNVSIIYKYVPILSTYDTNFKDKVSLSLLEPFSFHVPENEKSLAGTQFMFILILFLFSGFVLGLWWSKISK